MTDTQIKAIGIYRDLTFPDSNCSLKEALAYAKEDAFDAGLSIYAYLDYVYNNHKLPE